MRFLLAEVLAVCLVLTGCGEIFVGFVSNPSGSMSVSGTVSVVQFGFIQDPTGVKTNFTAVTFVNPESSITIINFCGDQRSRFPMNQFVRADFRTGFFCSTLVAVIVSTRVAYMDSRNALTPARRQCGGKSLVQAGKRP